MMKKITIVINKAVRKFWIILILIFSITTVSFVDNYFDISKNLEILASLYKEINTYYVDEIDPTKLMRTGIDAMLNSLDPYTKYISESEIENYRFQTTGKYGGIGAIIQKHKDFVIIKDPYEGFPADKSGLIAGDIILEINGESAKNKTTEDVSKILKGTPGTEVNVLIKRPPNNEEIEIKITREEIKVNSIPFSGMVTEHTGYIRLNSFTQHAGKEVREALKKLKENPKFNTLIFDLRGNPGGLLNEAVNVANVFIEKEQEIVSTKGKITEWEKIYKTLNPALDSDIPLVVLTNRGSASASEIVSGVIQDLDRGIIIGQRTYGKGLVQTTRRLSYNTQLKVTTAKYYIPSGRCIQAIDYSNRNEDGSAGKIPDSLKTEFKTKNGRIVYDGAGIAPDIEIEPKKLSHIAISLLSKNLIFDYATIYRSNHSTIPSVKDFKFTDKEYEDFISFLSDKEYDYTTKSEELLNDLEEKAQKEKYYDAIKEDLETLKSKMLHDKKKDLVKFKDEIKQLLKGEIVSRYYYQKGVIEASFNDDEVIQEAINLLDNYGKYEALLEENTKN